ncbi:MAG TPA: cyanophycinase [Thermoanaerobaculia bacterium]|jgi:cyanophycinase|nr:cyanophycinase [Thermoanaerobaculia bacterium]
MRRTWIAIATLVWPALVFAQTSAPASGTLVIQGGGASTIPRDEFIRLAGGARANIVVIPTAAGLDDYGEDFQKDEFRGFREQGVTSISLLHTTSRQVADSAEFIAPLEKATGVWFIGGRQWRLADAYLGTKTEAALRRLLERGGVIGGTSAGATILGSYLVRGDTRGALPPIGDHQRGFGFLKNSAIDQHLLVRNRQFDLLPIIHAHPELLGIGLDEKAAIVVHGDEFTVLDGYVAIYDPAIVLANDEFYFLRKGERFRLSTRTPMNAGGTPRFLPQILPHATLTAAEDEELAGTYRAGESLIRIAVTGGKVGAAICPGEQRELIAVTRDLWFDKYDGWKLVVHRAPGGAVSGFTWDLGRDAGSKRCLSGTVEAVRSNAP